MSVLPTGAHVLHLDSARGDSILTNGSVFPSCSCRKWRQPAMTRVLARELHDAHFQSVLSETEANDATD